MRGIAPLLPDPGVGFGPGRGDLVGEAGDRPPRLSVQSVAGVGEEPGGVEHPAVAVELVLAGGAVADADRAAVGVAGPPVELAFGWSGAAVEREQDGQAGSAQTAGMEEPGEEGTGLLAACPRRGTRRCRCMRPEARRSGSPSCDSPPTASGSEVVGAATGAPEGEYVSSRRVMRLRTTGSRCAATSMPATQARQPASSRGERVPRRREAR